MKSIQLKVVGITLSLLFSTTSFGQLSFEYNDSIPVINSGTPLEMPWAGGLNYAQFSSFDYDYDGDDDLFIFDRGKNNVIVYVRENVPGPHYRLEYNARLNFPPDLLYRGTMVDYDGDGKKDLFTYGIGGLRVFKNTGDAINGLQWTLVKNIVNSTYPMGTFNLFISTSDIPAIEDIDLDGDYDILTFNQGGSNVEYHKNMSIENYGHADSLEFVLRNECWGKFSEDAVANFINLNDPNAPCVGGSITNPEGKPTNQDIEKGHSGSSLLAIDIDNSGVMDLVLGDVSFPTLTLLTNSGSTVNADSPMISVDYTFPSNTTPVDITLFPAAFYVDVDFDGVKDLVAAPNAPNISRNQESVSYYQNIGSNAAPNFIFVTNNHFQNNMIEHGSGSVPILFDYNEDGLNDLIVANFYRTQDGLVKESIIAYYQNTGTPNAPEFTFIDEDIFGLLSQTFGLRAIPAFGDLDGDGDEDMLLGTENGELTYYENTSSGGGAVFAGPGPVYQDNGGINMTANAFAHPQIFDVNQDGLLDVVIGSRFGEIVYYENVGTTTSPSFQLSNPNLGGVNVTNGTPDGYAAPHFFLDSGVVKLFVGNLDGKLYYYDSISNNLGAGEQFHLVSQDFLDIDVGGYSSFWVEDLDGDSLLNMFVGQDLGGVFHFESDPNSDAAINELSVPEVIMYPNPTDNQVYLLAEERMEKVTLRDINGRMIKETSLSSTETIIELGNLPSGMYFIHVQFEDNQESVSKIMKR